MISRKFLSVIAFYSIFSLSDVECSNFVIPFTWFHEIFSSVILNFTGFFTLNIFLFFIFEIEICWLRNQLTYQSFCLYVHRRCMYCNFKIFLKLSSHVLQPLQQSVRDPAIKTASHHVPMKNTLQVYEFFLTARCNLRSL